MAGQLDEAAKQILGTLLADFTDRGLSASDLKKPYEGPKLDALATAVCNVEDITKVDFEVAFNELEKKKLIGTGPMEMIDPNRFGAGVFVIASVSKREYVYLTEAGYKESRKAPNKPQRVQRVVNNINITGGQFDNIQLAAGEQIQQTMSVTTGTDSEVVAQLISILESQGFQIGNEQRAEIENAVSEANQGNAGTAKSLMMKVCGSAWENIQQTAWPIIGELVKKSMGL
ncbi:hypothetical protein [Dickeya undicola]|uniref:AbiTii domain-containing protein n=1 Tax=Dickeya undicola TaxID=1577887 RepID=A0A3N0FPR5_9GAMM|nr:hypothetical protein [Dickeya undicola]RNM02123.1 hypothetical protein EF878_20425 [Dickeya undicola]